MQECRTFVTKSGDPFKTMETSSKIQIVASRRCKCLINGLALSFAGARFSGVEATLAASSGWAEHGFSSWTTAFHSI